MLKGREIRGLAVYAGRNREEVGRVSDMVVDGMTVQVIGLVIQNNGMLAKNLFVELQNVRELAKTGVIVPNKSHIKKLPKRAQTLYQQGWLGSPLYSHDGMDRGTVADILVQDGNVAGLEISSGFVSDLHNRREFLPWQNVQNRDGGFYEDSFH